LKNSLVLDLRLRLVDGLMWMGWDGLHSVDGMNIMLIPHFVWLVQSEGWDGKRLATGIFFFERVTGNTRNEERIIVSGPPISKTWLRRFGQFYRIS
jgi:hypothetical protein